MPWGTLQVRSSTPHARVERVAISTRGAIVPVEVHRRRLLAASYHLLEPVSELLAEEAVNDGVNTAIRRPKPLGHRYDDLRQ